MSALAAPPATRYSENAGVSAADGEFTDNTFRFLYILRDDMTSLDRSDDNDLLTALRHPLRRRILRRMDDDEAISPRELSRLLAEPLSNVSYHVRVLVDCS